MTVISILEHQNRKRLSQPRRHGVTAYVVSELTEEQPTVYIKLEVTGHPAGVASGTERFADTLNHAAFVEKAAKQEGNTVAIQLENGAHWPHIRGLVEQLIAESYEVSADDVQTFAEARLSVPNARF